MEKYVDLTYLEDICEGNKPAMKEFIQMFLDQRADIEARFKKCFTAKDWKTLGETAHLAKSTLRVVGINNIAEKMAQLELYCRENTNHHLYEGFVDHFYLHIVPAVSELRQIMETLDE